LKKEEYCIQIGFVAQRLRETEIGIEFEESFVVESLTEKLCQTQTQKLFH
jgi:hypothetical protein